MVCDQVAYHHTLVGNYGHTRSFVRLLTMTISKDQAKIAVVKTVKWILMVDMVYCSNKEINVNIYLSSRIFECALSMTMYSANPYVTSIDYL